MIGALRGTGGGEFRDPDLRRRQWRGVGALTEREVLRVLRLWSQTIAPQVIAAVLFIVVFGIALGTQIRGVAGLPYDQFIVPGLVLMGIGTAAFSNTATSIYQARWDGFIEDPATSPMTSGQLTLAYLLGGIVRGLVIGLLTLAAARAFVGFPVERPLVLALALLLAATAFSALGVVVGLYAKGWDLQAFVTNLVIQPLVFLGGVFYSVESLTQPWRSLTFADPIFYMVDLARFAMLGYADVEPWLALTVTAGLSIALVGWAWWAFDRGIGLRT